MKQFYALVAGIAWALVLDGNPWFAVAGVVSTLAVLDLIIEDAAKIR